MYLLCKWSFPSISNGKIKNKLKRVVINTDYNGGADKVFRFITHKKTRACEHYTPFFSYF